MSGPATEMERCLGTALRAAVRLLRCDPELQVEAEMNPDGSYNDPETEALLAEYEDEIDCPAALLAEIDMKLDRAPPGLPADYRVGDT